MTIIVGATILDGRGSEPRRGAALLVEDGRIRDVGREGDLPAGADVLRLDGLTILPGLIDAHVHLMGMRGMDTREHAFVGRACGLRGA